MKNFILTFVTCMLVLSTSTLKAQPNLAFETIASGFVEPVDITNAGDDRLFIVERAGKIKMLKTNGSISTFLNISSMVLSTGLEQGLLSLTFDPNYEINGFFYVNYINTDGNTHISRFSVSNINPSFGDPESEEILLIISQPENNHNGGDLNFGPDGYLYCALGDGGGIGDPAGHAQNTHDLLGKILRIDVSDPTGYINPISNPFIGVDGSDEIWAYGLRNPWRFSFDNVTGDMWIGDVGQFEYEEVNFEEAGSTGGLNYGWSCYEGDEVYNIDACNEDAEYVFPAFEYEHDFATGGYSITGGFVYRGSEFPGLYGLYICSDFVTGNFWTIHETDGTFNVELIPGLQNSISSFGENVNGEIYACNLVTGAIYHLLDQNCAQVNGFAATTTATTAALSWTDVGSSTYKISYKPLYVPGAIATTTTGTESIMLSGLMPSTTYMVTVKNKCPGGSIYSYTDMFTTLNARMESIVGAHSIYPNPGGGIFNIDAIYLNINSIQVADISGNLVKEISVDRSSNIQLNLSDIAEGMYIIKGYNDDKIELIEKIIIAR